MEGKEDKDPVENFWIAYSVLGIIILTILFYSSGMWVNSQWVSNSYISPNLLVCDLNTEEFAASDTLSNTTGFPTTMVTIFEGNSSLILFSDQIASNEIVSIGRITWSDGNTIGLFQKKITNGRYVITSSYMLNFTIYGTHGTYAFPVVENLRMPNSLENVLAENQTIAKMILGSLYALGYTFVVVSLLSHLRTRERRVKQLRRRAKNRPENVTPE